MTIERILRNSVLVDEIARRLATGAAEGAFTEDRLRAAAAQVQRGQESALSRVEEAIIRREGRPVYFVRKNRIEAPAEGFWSERLRPTREKLEARLPSIGRIDLARHPRSAWVGTGWLVAPDVIVTNRHVAREFGSMSGAHFVLDVDPFGRPVGVSVDFLHEYQSNATNVFDVVRILHVEEGAGRPDVALLKIAHTGVQGEPSAVPLVLAETDPKDESVVAVVGYPAWDGRRNAEDVMTRLFDGVFDCKRFHPGEILGGNSRYLTHDCSTLGGNSGSVVLDFETGSAVGLHYAGYYEDENFAVKASALAEILHRLKILGGSAAASPRPNDRPAPAAPEEAVTATGGVRVEPATMAAVERLLTRSAEAAQGADADSAELTPTQLRELIRLLGRAQERLADAAETSTDLGGSPEDETASRLQSWLRTNASQRARLLGLDGEVKFDERDLRWGLSLLNWLRGLKKHAQKRPTAGPEALPNDVRIAIVGDWGSGSYAAPAVGETIGRSGYGLAVHLGDVYYAGTENEVLENFLRFWPLAAPGLVSRALNSNHEMYSGGYGYFDVTLPAFGQLSSYFAAQNEHYTLVGLDTGYDEHDLDDEQSAWLEHIVEASGGRKIVLMSHHQLFAPGTAPAKQLIRRLGKMLVSRRVFAWYWGHEHCAMVFDQHARWGLYGRCIGHGGFPYFRYKGEAPIEAGPAGSRWRLLRGNEEVPSCKLLDDPNPYVAPQGNPERYGAQGFASIELRGPSLLERLHRPDGVVIYEKTLA